MRILFITDNYLPHIGGSRIYYHHLYANMPGRPTVVLTNRHRNSKEFDKEQRLVIYRTSFGLVSGTFPVISSLLRYVFLTAFAVYLVIRHQITIIHCGESEPAGVVGRILHCLFGLPYVMYIHDDPEIPGLRWYPIAMHASYRNASGVIAACSQAVRNAAKYGVAKEKISLIQTALEPEILRLADSESIRSAYDLKGRKVLLTVGRLVEEKGHEEVLRIIPMLMKQVPDLVYIIVGEGSLEDYLRRLAFNIGLDKRVIFAGLVPSAKLPEYYAACDIFIMLNKELKGVSKEGLGRVFLEASAQGKPVVGSRSGGTEDSIVHEVTGFRLDICEQNRLIKTLAYLLKDSNAAGQLGANGRNYVLSNFSNWQMRSVALYRFSRMISYAGNKHTAGGHLGQENPNPIYN